MNCSNSAGALAGHDPPGMVAGTGREAARAMATMMGAILFSTSALA